MDRVISEVKLVTKEMLAQDLGLIICQSVAKALGCSYFHAPNQEEAE
jgi:hypothetical protein